jgi:integrase
VTRGAGRATRDNGTFGTVHKLPSGRYRAMYYGPDRRRYTAPSTFTSKREAKSWLSLRQSEIIRKAWEPPEASARAATTFADYAEQWMTQRELKARTREHYRVLLDAYLLPEFGSAALSAITADVVRSWYAHALAGKPTRRAHCYSLLRTILRTAAHDGKIAANPCLIKGAGTTKRAKVIRPATTEELAKITAEMPEHYQAMIPLASWCGLRFGELTELRRKDLVLDPDKQRGAVRVERAVVHVDNDFVVTTPKSDAGCRDVAVPPHLVAVLQEHLARHVCPEPDALLFPAKHGGHLAPSTLYGRFRTAREKAGRPDLRFHDLRHTGAVLAALTGATIAELMARLGHSAPAAAMRYQHAAAGRDEQIAAALSKIALGS